MPEQLQLEVTLLSDATFGRGDGVAGLIDAEVEHDEYGLPSLRGRTIKGLLVEECANLLYALGAQTTNQAKEAHSALERAAQSLFGDPGSTTDTMGRLRVGTARLPDKFRQAISSELEREEPTLTKEEVLAALTAIRRQAAVSVTTGAPLKNSLRSMRVVLRETVFVAPLMLEEGDDAKVERALLAACALGLRRGGTGRNRGRGRLACRLLDASGSDLTADCFADFRQLVQPNVPAQADTAEVGQFSAEPIPEEEASA
jgi:plasmid stabilization system protein ParE